MEHKVVVALSPHHTIPERKRSLEAMWPRQAHRRGRSKSSNRSNSPDVDATVSDSLKGERRGNKVLALSSRGESNIAHRFIGRLQRGIATQFKRPEQRAFAIGRVSQAAIVADDVDIETKVYNNVIIKPKKSMKRSNKNNSSGNGQW